MTSEHLYRPWHPDELNPDVSQNLKLTTAAAVEEIHQQAYSTGFEEGRREGYAAGLQQGQQYAEIQGQALETLVQSLQEAAHVFGARLNEHVLTLALDLSRQLLRQALQVHPELLLPLIRQLLDSLPQRVQQPHLHLHPDDAVLVRQHFHTELAENGWRIVEDKRIARGGVRVETAETDIDATLPSRWQRLAQALGQDSAWLDHSE